jgi:hypothetical protein
VQASTVSSSLAREILQPKENYMHYTKPRIINVESAAVAIQGSKSMPLQDSDVTNPIQSNAAAYEADE